METFCLKERKKTKCIEQSGTKASNNGRRMFWCTCVSCGIKKYRFVSSKGKTTKSKKLN